MMKFGIERFAARATELVGELVTDLVFNDDGTVDGKGLDDRDIPTTKPGYHFGFYSRPKDGAVGVVLRFLGLSFLAAWRDKQFEMSLQKGEVGAQNAFGAYWLLDQNGVLNLNGTSYVLVKDGFIDDVVALLQCVASVLGSNCVNGAPLVGMGTGAAGDGKPGTNATEITRLMELLATVANYKSQKVKFG